MTHQTVSAAAMAPWRMRAAVADRARSSIVALIAFLTLVDLFATQAILPSLVRVYRVTPAAMGFAVNATTIGMAVSSLAVAVLSQRIDRKLGVVVCLAVLAIPTSLLAIAPDLMTFTGLRVVQGLCMAGAFTLTLAYLGEHFTGAEAAAAFAAYITGNVASNFIGRLMSAALADHFGIAANFVAFAVLNLSGALVVYLTLERGADADGAAAHFRVDSRARQSPRQPAARLRLRNRVLHPLCLYRGVHLRQFCHGATPDRTRHDGDRLRLFRLPALHVHGDHGRKSPILAMGAFQPKIASWRRAEVQPVYEYALGLLELLAKPSANVCYLRIPVVQFVARVMTPETPAHCDGTTIPAAISTWRRPPRRLRRIRSRSRVVWPVYNPDIPLKAPPVILTFAPIAILRLAGAGGASGNLT